MKLTFVWLTTAQHQIVVELRYVLMGFGAICVIESGIPVILELHADSWDMMDVSFIVKYYLLLFCILSLYISDYTGYFRYYSFYYYYSYQSSEWFYHLGKVNCLGNESRLSDCQESDNTAYCSSRYGIYVVCYGMLYMYALVLSLN